MLLGAVLRRSSKVGARHRVAVSTIALCCALASPIGLTAAHATRPYPPTAPCALSVTASATSANDAVVTGSGLDADRPVTITWYPKALRVGSAVTDSIGSFSTAVSLPQSDGDEAWVTARTPTRTCTGEPPPIVGGSGPSSPGTDAPGTGPAGPSGTSSTGTGSGTGSSGTGSDTGGSVSSGASGSRGGAASGGGSGSGSGSTPRDSSAPGATGSTANYPPTRSGGSTRGSADSSTPSTGGLSTRPAASTPPANRADDRRPAALGLSITTILAIAILLLLAGGVGVFVLTRRTS